MRGYVFDYVIVKFPSMRTEEVDSGLNLEWLGFPWQQNKQTNKQTS